MVTGAIPHRPINFREAFCGSFWMKILAVLLMAAMSERERPFMGVHHVGECFGEVSWVKWLDDMPVH